MDWGKEKESKNVVDHSNYLNQRFNHMDTADKVMFWRMMRDGKSEESYLPNIRNPNVMPDSPPLDISHPDHPVNQFLSQLLQGLMNRGR